MAKNFLTQIFGSRNDRLLKQYRKTVDRINALESQFEKLGDDAAARQDAGVQGPDRQGRNARRPPARGLRRGARGLQARHEDAPLRRAAAGRHGAAQRQDRRDGHRRRQDADGHAAGVPECPDRQGRARRHGQRLPGQPRRAVDGQAVQLPGPDGRRQPAEHAARGKAGGLPRRHHLRHQQRVRLRLPARQHGVRGGGPRPARPELRHRRRGGLDPDRRGAHAADHQRPGRGPHRPVHRDEPGGAAARHARKARPTRAPARASSSPATSPSTRRPTRCS